MKELEGWEDFITEEQCSPILKQIEGLTISPTHDKIFRVFGMLKPADIKVVVVGQDPYPNPAVADGIAFSSPSNKLPPSLRNIFKELDEDIYYYEEREYSGDLERWVEQGVFLINSSLTCLAGVPGSHTELWREATDGLLRSLSLFNPDIVFLLMGNVAKEKEKLLEGGNYVVSTVHPSPLSASRGWFGSRPFSEINNQLMLRGKGIINW